LTANSTRIEPSAVTKAVIAAYIVWIIMRHMFNPDTSSCFGAVHPEVSGPLVQVDSLGLRGAEALATLLPVLQCGEESASLVFDALALTAVEADQQALHIIATEERVHEQLLYGLAASLPRPLQQASVRTAARRFYLRQQHRSSAVHFVRIAALDSGACIILSALLRPMAVVAQAPPVLKIFKRIYADEARHVRLSRRHAIGRLDKAIATDIAHHTRAQLVEVLRSAGNSFEHLGVDADKLYRYLSVVPEGLCA
jgi:hypothetical protein